MRPLIYKGGDDMDDKKMDRCNSGYYILLLGAACKEQRQKMNNVKEHKEKEVENVQKEQRSFPYHFPLTGIGTKAGHR